MNQESGWYDNTDNLYPTFTEPDTAQLSASNIDKVILIGGPSRMSQQLLPADNRYTGKYSSIFIGSTILSKVSWNLSSMPLFDKPIHGLCSFLLLSMPQ